MNNDTQAIVIIYNGKEPNKEALGEMIRILGSYGICHEGGHITTFDPDSLAKIIASNVIINKQTPAQDAITDHVEDAYVYIGKNYVKYLMGDNQSDVNLVLAIQNDRRIDKMLERHLSVIAQNQDYVMPRSIVHKYGLGINARKAILACATV